MPNGKGALDCCYCDYFRSDSGYRGYDAAYEAGTCEFHERRLPSTQERWGHRICISFRSTPEYYDHNPRYEHEGVFRQCSPQRRFLWFGKDLEDDTLYAFHYNDPLGSLEPLARIADLPPCDTTEGSTG